MARPDDDVILPSPVRRRRRADVDDAGGPVPPPSTGTVPTGPSGEPIVTLGGGIPGPPGPPPPAPISPVVPIPPAPPPPSPAPLAPEPPPVIGPPDWWDAMPVNDRLDLIRQIESLQANTGQLETQLAQARNRIGELEAQIQVIPTPGEPRLDELLAAPPWATPAQIPTIPPIPPDFRATPDYTALTGRDTTFERDIARLRTALDNVALAAGNSQADIASLRGQLTSIAANPTLVPLGPTAQEVSNAIAAYLSVEANRAPLRGAPGPAGRDGRDAPALPAPSRDVLRGLVNEAIAGVALPVGPIGPIGPPGPRGPAGPAGDTPSADALAAIIEEALGDELAALSNLPDAVWGAVLGGSRERLSRLWLATLEAL